MKNLTPDIYRLKLTEDGPEIIDEEELLEQLYDEIVEIKTLMESIYDQNMEILKSQHKLKYNIPNILDDNS